ncbi:UDP-glycosyltransferase 708G1-like [Macadamia integrifolia]|uniref:UDP-glycosyltransferase 708G1-like n=1 Tax=Macadamia integrifolia TaxID=60698 RepID=UPI001C4E6C50|nr:UDP-glycosyltransferase 708G1-like [Macadamia integrifolia]
MADSSDRQQAHPHIALLPSSGMGHLVPFVRLAATLAAHDCRVTFITTHPTVSLAESSLVARLLSAFPHAVTPKGFHILPLDPSTANSKDPFFLQFEAIRRSAHLLSHLLNSSSHSGHPPLSALVTDVTLASAVIPVTHDLHIPNYVLFTSSAKMLSLLAYFPALVGVTHSDEINIPGIPPLHKTWLPPPLLDQTNLFTTQFTENGEALVRSDGILINTFKSLEPETVAALNEGKVINGLPPVIPVGPLVPCECETERGGSSLMEWLDGQEKGSVVYVSFGSRTAMSREQIREVGEGLVRSGCGFVWVVKDKKVDREEEGVEEVVGRGLMERIVKDRKGVVVNRWVDQEAILSLEAVGGFVSHCGWNSVMEAAWHGVRLLAWPQGGDQRINAEVVERSGLGVWVRRWQWGGGGVNVKAEEIDERVREMMGNERLRVTAAQVRDEARKAAELGGASQLIAGLVGEVAAHY